MILISDSLLNPPCAIIEFKILIIFPAHELKPSSSMRSNFKELRNSNSFSFIDLSIDTDNLSKVSIVSLLRKLSFRDLIDSAYSIKFLLTLLKVLIVLSASKFINSLQK